MCSAQAWDCDVMKQSEAPWIPFATHLQRVEPFFSDQPQNEASISHQERGGPRSEVCLHTNLKGKISEQVVLSLSHNRIVCLFFPFFSFFHPKFSICQCFFFKKKKSLCIQISHMWCTWNNIQTKTRWRRSKVQQSSPPCSFSTSIFASICQRWLQTEMLLPARHLKETGFH